MPRAIANPRPKPTSNLRDLAVYIILLYCVKFARLLILQILLVCQRGVREWGHWGTGESSNWGIGEFGVRGVRGSMSSGLRDFQGPLIPPIPRFRQPFAHSLNPQLPSPKFINTQIILLAALVCQGGQGGHGEFRPRRPLARGWRGRDPSSIPAISALDAVAALAARASAASARAAEPRLSPGLSPS